MDKDCSGAKKSSLKLEDLQLYDEHPLLMKKNCLSEKQLFQLRQQILAYKYLIRNMQVPEEVEENVLSLSEEQWAI